MPTLFDKYCQALQSLIDASAKVYANFNGDMLEVTTVKAHYEHGHQWLDISFFNQDGEQDTKRLVNFTQFSVAFPQFAPTTQYPLDLNPKPYHVELRRDTGNQEIILEDDIFTEIPQQAESYLIAWAKLYNTILQPKEGLVVVLTNTWTQETILQGSLKEVEK